MARSATTALTRWGRAQEGLVALWLVSDMDPLETTVDQVVVGDRVLFVNSDEVPPPGGFLVADKLQMGGTLWVIVTHNLAGDPIEIGFSSGAVSIILVERA